MLQNSFLKQIANATRYSFDGFKFLLSSEFAARIEIYFFIWLFPVLIYFELPIELIISSVILFLFLLAIEALNTAVEVIVDRVSPEISPMGKQAKDLGSFAVMAVLVVNLIHLAYAVAKLNFAKFSWGSTLFVSAVLLFLGLYLAINESHQKVWKWLIAALTIIYLIFTGVYLASDYFTGVGFDYKVVYHLRAGLTGAGFGEYIGLMVWMSLYCLVGVAVVYILNDVLGNRKLSLSKKVAHFKFRDVTFGRNQLKKNVASPEQKNTLRALSIPILFLALISNPFGQDVYELAKYQRIATEKISEFDFYAQPENVNLSRKKNVVFIYLESLERTYFDEEIFGDLVPNLRQLEAEHISFKDMRHVYHTEWTIAGMLASQCGVPLYTSSQGNAMNAYDVFMPNALCLGDILSKNGYNLKFMNGGSLDFAGKGKFYRSHGFDETVGKDEFKIKSVDKSLYSHWGLHDDALFNYAYEAFLEKSELGENFGLFLLTLDTHHPTGHRPPICADIVHQDGKNEMLNAIKCSDFLVGNFVNKIRGSRYAKDTLIVVMSDHKAMKNQASPLLKTGKRRNLFFIIDPASRRAVTSDRPASSLDVAPTVLSLLGATEDVLGFGRNLLGPQPTLMEEKGKGANPFLIAMKSTMQAELWQFPDLSDGLQFEVAENTLKIGERSLEIPLLIHLDAEKQMKDLKFNPPTEVQEADKIDKGDGIVWLDRCKVLAGFMPNETNTSASESDSVANTGNEIEIVAKTAADIATKPDGYCAVLKRGDVISSVVLDSSMPLFTDMFP